MEDMIKRYLTIKNTFFSIAIILAVVFIVHIKALALLFFASFVVACSLMPLVDRLSQKLKRTTAAGLVLGGAIAIFLAFVLPIVHVAIHQITSFLSNLPKTMEPLKKYLETNVSQDFSSQQTDISGVIPSISDCLSKVIDNSINFSMGFAQNLIYLLVAMLVIYYILADKQLIKNTTLRLFPIAMRDKTGIIIDSISEKV